MDASIMVIVVLFVIAVLFNCLLNIYLKKYFLSAIISATLSTFVFQFIGYLIMGYLDPFFLIALVGGWIAVFKKIKTNRLNIHRLMSSIWC